MNDRQPLLRVTSILSLGDDDGDHENKKQLLTTSIPDWCRCFSRKKNDEKYTKLNDDTQHSVKDEAFGIFRL
ncbi:unnamed protein product, partial [Rotaria sp. Silwood2]